MADVLNKAALLAEVEELSVRLDEITAFMNGPDFPSLRSSQREYLSLRRHWMASLIDDTQHLMAVLPD